MQVQVAGRSGSFSFSSFFHTTPAFAFSFAEEEKRHFKDVRCSRLLDSQTPRRAPQQSMLLESFSPFEGVCPWVSGAEGNEVRETSLLFSSVITGRERGEGSVVRCFTFERLSSSSKHRVVVLFLYLRLVSISINISTRTRTRKIVR